MTEPRRRRAPSFTIDVDSARQVVQSDLERFAIGHTLTGTSWMGEAILEVVDTAKTLGGEPRRAARDPERGEHWVLSARTIAQDPWRARVVGVDATHAVLADRREVLAAIAHEVRNASFGLTSVLDAFALERPTGVAVEAYLVHLREPVSRLLSTMQRVQDWVQPRAPSRAPVDVAVVVERALAKMAVANRPTSVRVRDGSARIDGDVDLLAEVVAAMVESGGEGGAASLDVSRSTECGEASARIVVERRAMRNEEATPAALWDFGEGPALGDRVRLASARAIVVEHGGRVMSARREPGRIRLTAILPLPAA